MPSPRPRSVDLQSRFKTFGPESLQMASSALCSTSTPPGHEISYTCPNTPEKAPTASRGGSSALSDCNHYHLDDSPTLNHLVRSLQDISVSSPEKEDFNHAIKMNRHTSTPETAPISPPPLDSLVRGNGHRIGSLSNNAQPQTITFSSSFSDEEGGANTQHSSQHELKAFEEDDDLNKRNRDDKMSGSAVPLPSCAEFDQNNGNIMSRLVLVPCLDGLEARLNDSASFGWTTEEGDDSGFGNLESSFSPADGSTDVNPPPIGCNSSSCVPSALLDTSSVQLACGNLSAETSSVWEMPEFPSRANSSHKLANGGNQDGTSSVCLDPLRSLNKTATSLPGANHTTSSKKEDGPTTPAAARIPVCTPNQAPAAMCDQDFLSHLPDSLESVTEDLKRLGSQIRVNVEDDHQVRTVLSMMATCGLSANCADGVTGFGDTTKNNMEDEDSVSYYHEFRPRTPSFPFGYSRSSSSL